MPLGLGSLSGNSVPITAKYRQKIIDILCKHRIGDLHNSG
jgi:hypothetical protein